MPESRPPSGIRLSPAQALQGPCVKGIHIRNVQLQVGATCGLIFPSMICSLFLNPAPNGFVVLVSTDSYIILFLVK